MGGQELRGQGLGFSIPTTSTPVSSIITTVRQQDYSASVWLRRRDKLEHVSPGYWSWRNRWEEAVVHDVGDPVRLSFKVCTLCCSSLSLSFLAYKPDCLQVNGFSILQRLSGCRDLVMVKGTEKVL